MPYLPPGIITETEFPKAWGRDLANFLRLIEEKWRRFFPEVTYYPLLKDDTVAGSFDTPVGTAGNTIFDPLYGEAVDAGMLTAGVISQPHLSGIYNAGNPEVYDNGTVLNFQIQASELEVLLKKYGFDKTRTLVAMVPVSVLDRNGITATEGDYLTWDGKPYYVNEVQRDSFWKNSNVQIFVVLGCTPRRMGA